MTPASETTISKDDIRAKIDDLLPTIDLANTGLKQFTKLLSKKFYDGADLKKFKGFIKDVLTEAINNQDSEDEPEEEVVDEEEEEETPTKTKKTGKGGYNAPKELSPKLAKFLGTKELSRPQVVKQLWEYIKEKELQNPSDRREILLDDRLRKVFHCDRFNMFSMSKYISHHTHPFPKLDLTPSPKKKTTTGGGSSSKKRSIQSSKDGSPAKKRKSGTQPPYRLSEALTNVLGKDILPRPQVVSGLWDYIKANNLQNPQDKREILCDDKLKAIFKGKKSVTMFSMNKYISTHLIEKVERSEYVENGGEDSE